MAGTFEGGIAAARTNKEKYGDDYYARIGAEGGKRGHTGGFASPCNKAHCIFKGPHKIGNCAGQKGGRISRRGEGRMYA